MTYYWDPVSQQYQYMQGQYGQIMPPTTSGGSIQSASQRMTTTQFREESYIENILRLNRGKQADFYFTVPSATQTLGSNGGNTIRVRGSIVEAGRDHAVIRETNTNHYFLFPMIYFDYAEFDEEITYLNQR